MRYLEKDTSKTFAMIMRTGSVQRCNLGGPSVPSHTKAEEFQVLHVLHTFGLGQYITTYLTFLPPSALLGSTQDLS